MRMEFWRGTAGSEGCCVAHDRLGPMEDTQKNALLIVAAPRLKSQLDSKDSPARDTVISESVRDAEHILRTIDNLHPET